MEINRILIKKRAKEAIFNNYVRCVIAALILTFLAQGAQGLRLNFSSDEKSATTWETVTQKMAEFDLSGIVGDVQSDVGTIASKVQDFLISPIFAGVAIIGAVIAALASVLALLFRIFVSNPLEVGGARFFLTNTDEEKAPVGLLLYAFQQGEYLDVVKVMFCRNLFIVLWSFLFVIPGIIKAYQYRMVPYLLAEDPTLDTRTALEQSREIMQGYKMAAFVYDLSFIGWWILSGITGGLAGYFFVGPYKYAADAQLYLDLTMREYSNYTNYREIVE